MADDKQQADPFESAGSAALTAGIPAGLNPTLTADTLKMLSSMGPRSIIPAGMPLSTMMPTPTQPQPPVPGVRGEGISQPDNREFATRSGNRRVALNNLMGSVSRLVDRFSNYEEQKRVRSMSMDIQTLFNAMQGMTQAQASGDQENIQRNQQIINDILSDPKKQKSLQKAFNIQLFGKDKDKDSPERMALNHALQEWQKGGKKGLSPIAQQFMNKVPTTQQMNPQLSMLSQLVNSNLMPGAKEQLDWQKSASTAISNAMKEEFSAKSKEDVANILAQAKDRETLGRYFGVLAKVAGAKNALEVMARTKIKQAQIMAGEHESSARWRAMGEVVSRIMGATAGNASMKGMNQAAGNLQKEFNMLDKESQSLAARIQAVKGDSWFGATGAKVKGALGMLTPETKAEVQQFDMNVKKYEQVQQQKADVINKINTLNGLVGGIGGTGDGSTGGNNDSSGQSGSEDNSSDQDFQNIYKFFFNDDQQ